MSLKNSYDGTLNLPKTKFSMKASLTKREPLFYENWVNTKFYYKLLQKNSGKPEYVLHDGPPYANGEIHLGTALNKILKDFIIKQKNMSGFKAAFVPGWDTHGLPIELKVLKGSGVDRTKLNALELRKMCENYARTQIELQKKQFQSLGVIGDFDHFYATFDRKFEASQLKVFSKMVKNGQIYKGSKPVYYCSTCLTALAESEIEYFDDDCDSIYVKFKVADDYGFFEQNNIDKNKVYFLIWTTTTWTLPANVAICLGPNYSYAVVRVGDEFYVVAEKLVSKTMEVAGVKDFEVVCVCSASDFENFSVFHPFLSRKSKIIFGNHVTLDSGTGCVHTAPGHGVEDFEVCRKYEDIPTVVVVDKYGKMNEDAFDFCGLSLEEANVEILRTLKQSSHLFADQKIVHSYPHCWRCKKPVLFRATEQWFCSVDEFKSKAIEAVNKVTWIPDWGQIRIRNMIADRSDWCISRQRVWGVPIPAFYCEDCGACILNESLIENVVEIVGKFGSNAWFEKPSSDFTKGFKCDKCGGSKFKKESDIMDVWFDSGCSHSAVLNENYGLSFPAQLYLEGADQYRGWFQSSLLTAVATRNEPPFEVVCTHGWVVDGQGRKMSKSLANGVSPEKIVTTFGSDILRLWVASSDYHSDIRISDEILKQLTETYRKIRNTARFMLANLADFNPENDLVELQKLSEIDKFALFKLNSLIDVARKAYASFEFFKIYHHVRNFCVVDLSNFYLDVVKDRLYCDFEKGFSRRAAQTAIFHILDSLTRIIAPLISFTAEEIWSNMSHRREDDVESVFFNEMNSEFDLSLNEQFFEKWNLIEKLRNAVKKVLEIEREKKKIGSSLESKIVFYCNDSAYKIIKSFSLVELKNIFLVSQVELKDSSLTGEHLFENLGVSLSVVRPEGEKCERCWNFDVTVGESLEHKTLCARCVDVLKKIGQ